MENEATNSGDHKIENETYKSNSLTSSRNPSKDEQNLESESRNTQSAINSKHNSKEESNPNSTSTSRTTSLEDKPTATNWWNVISSVAADVSAAVVAGVKEEIEEIKEDITTVASASVTASQKLAEVSVQLSEKVKEQATVAAFSGKEFLEKDLSEFGRVLNEETQETVKDVKVVGNFVANTMTSWAANISEVVSKSSIANTGYYDGYDQGIIGKNRQKVNFVSALEARLHNLRTDSATYCNEPEDEADYELWKETFDMDATKSTISDLLVASTEVRSLYTKHVPAEVAHQEFWMRYFYKLDALERAERRRNALMERADKSGTEDDEDLSWGDEDSSNDEESKPKEQSKPKEESSNGSGSSLQIIDKEILNNEEIVVVQNTETEKPVKKVDSKTPLESDDWEKEFDIEDLNMSEAEIEKVLENNEHENLDDWE